MVSITAGTEILCLWLRMTESKGHPMTGAYRVGGRDCEAAFLCHPVTFPPPTVIQGRLTGSKEPFPPPAEQFPNKLTPLSSGLRPAPFRSGKQKEGPFMGRLRANFARLGNPMQDCHLRKEPTLRNLLLCLQGRMTESQSPLPKEGGGAVRRRRIGASVLSDIFGAYHQDFNQLFSEEGALQFVMRRSANPQSPFPIP